MPAPVPTPRLTEDHSHGLVDRRHFMAMSLAGVLSLPLAGCLGSGSDRRRPNIVVVMADDIGPGDIGFYHSQRTGSDPVVPTPNLDRLIRDGMRFGQAYSPSAICAPTRFSMLTGNYPYRHTVGSLHGAWSPVKDPGIDPANTTSARLARDAGYATAFFGKWGCGGEMRDASGQPVSHEDEADLSAVFKSVSHFGFDYALELLRGIQNGPFAFYENGSWLPLTSESRLVSLSPTQHGVTKTQPAVFDIGDSEWDPTAVGPMLAAKAAGYITERATGHASQPFFLYYCSQAVHTPHTPAESLGDNPVAGIGPSNRGDMVVELDAQVGELVGALEANGIRENTLFVFTSDNGGLPGRDNALASRGHDSTDGLRGSKGHIHEGGSRVPFIVNWPGVVEPGSASDALVVGHDIVATIAAIASTGSPPANVMDSLNLLPLLTGDEGAEGHEVVLHQSSGAREGYAIRRGRWKLIFSGERGVPVADLVPVGLFDLEENPKESEGRNLVADPEHQSLVRELNALYVELRTTGRATVVS